jgi:hypothetical protein
MFCFLNDHSAVQTYILLVRPTQEWHFFERVGECIRRHSAGISLTAYGVFIVNSLRSSCFSFQSSNTHAGHVIAFACMEMSVDSTRFIIYILHFLTVWWLLYLSYLHKSSQISKFTKCHSVVAPMQFLYFNYLCCCLRWELIVTWLSLFYLNFDTDKNKLIHSFCALLLSLINF